MGNRVLAFFDSSEERDRLERSIEPLDRDETARRIAELQRTAEIELSWIQHRTIDPYATKREYLLNKQLSTEMTIEDLKARGLRASEREPAAQTEQRVRYFCYLEQQLLGIQEQLRMLDSLLGSVDDRRQYYRNIMMECGTFEEVL